MAMPPSELTPELEDAFKNATVLCNSEVAWLLEKTREARAKVQGQGPTVPLPPLVEKALAYCSKFNCGSNQETVQVLREHLENSGLQPYEVGTIANLMPESAEEAAALLPSLRVQEGSDIPPRFSRDDLQAILDVAQQYKQYS